MDATATATATPPVDDKTKAEAEAEAAKAAAARKRQQLRRNLRAKIEDTRLGRLGSKRAHKKFDDMTLRRVGTFGESRFRVDAATTRTINAWALRWCKHLLQESRAAVLRDVGNKLPHSFNTVEATFSLAVTRSGALAADGKITFPKDCDVISVVVIVTHGCVHTALTASPFGACMAVHNNSNMLMEMSLCDKTFAGLLGPDATQFPPAGEYRTIGNIPSMHLPHIAPWALFDLHAVPDVMVAHDVVTDAEFDALDNAAALEGALGAERAAPYVHAAAKTGVNNQFFSNPVRGPLRVLCEATNLVRREFIAAPPQAAQAAYQAEMSRTRA